MKDNNCMSIYTFNNKVLKHNNKLLVGGEPVSPMTSYSGVLELSQYDTYASGFNGIGEIWSRGGEGYASTATFGGKHCADVRSKTLRVDITGNNVTFNIINWYRTNSDYVGTANFNVLLKNLNPTYTFPDQILNKDIVAFGDNSPIYMSWSATYPLNENVCVSAKINEAWDTMFIYRGGNNFD